MYRCKLFHPSAPRRCKSRPSKIEEISGTSGTVETQIVVEAETIFDVPANGIYYANLAVTGVPVISPTTSNSARRSVPPSFVARGIDWPRAVADL
jgi:hypothetical protein